MKQIYEADNAVNANLLKDLLEDADIEATVQDERIAQLAGGVAVVYPTVWVNDEDFDAARKIVAEFERERAQTGGAGTWTCPKCGERVEGRFTACWKCDAEGKEREASPPKRRRVPAGLVLFLLALAALIVGFLMVASRNWRH